ncbi:acyltransferase [Empedobacter sp. 225-1]|uniref:acyltransferase n=1 Tax=Empedobacter sp. 225-1 TaxID=2746725 RepID=UPI002574CD71|nr:acyltransferase [Empedobacter sp. 225-1]MDM1522308.1 acyltransferase [Empedobacter sp. 225-1]
MKNLLKKIRFIPFFNEIYERKYYATGLGTLIINLFFKYILRINYGNLLFHFTSRANSPSKIIINNDNNKGSYFSFATSAGCYYQAINGIEIGENTIWSFNCAFISSNHDLNDYSKHVKSDPIRIGNNVWIGANCVILPGVQIGDNAIIGAGSVVTKNIPNNSVAVGNPCKVIRNID